MTRIRKPLQICRVTPTGWSRRLTHDGRTIQRPAGRTRRTCDVAGLLCAWYRSGRSCTVDSSVSGLIEAETTGTSRATSLMRRKRSPPTLQLQAFGTNAKPVHALPAGWQTLYKSLFPVEEERDECEDIERWISAAHERGRLSPWAELLLVGDHAGDVGSIAFLSLHYESGWIFGNYLGIAQRYRSVTNLRNFFRIVTQASLHTVPHARGILFEVERYSESVARSLLESIASNDHPPRLRQDQAASIDAIRRIHLYHRLRGVAGIESARMITFNNGKPIPYFQPAMQIPLDPTNEVPLWLMLLPLKSSEHPAGPIAIDIRNVLDFLYFGLFKSGYGSQSHTPLPGFDNYIESAMERMLSLIGDRPVVASSALTLSPTARSLLLKLPRRTFQHQEGERSSL